MLQRLALFVPASSRRTSLDLNGTSNTERKCAAEQESQQIFAMLQRLATLNDRNELQARCFPGFFMVFRGFFMIFHGFLSYEATRILKAADLTFF